MIVRGYLEHWFGESDLEVIPRDTERKGDMMLQDKKNRTLGRFGARELTRNEVENVTGGFQPSTKTLCTLASDGSLDGDVSLGEC